MVHTAHFAHECVRVTAPIEPSEIRLFEATNSKNIKLKLADITGLCRYVPQRDYYIATVLKSWLRGLSLQLSGREADSHTIAPTYIGDEQDLPFQAIGARRGMASFRDNLINRYGARCMISDGDVLAILEACND
jgi:hypothetical protein